jgi:hypothetical protein
MPILDSPVGSNLAIGPAVFAGFVLIECFLQVAILLFGNGRDCERGIVRWNCKWHFGAELLAGMD